MDGRKKFEFRSLINFPCHRSSSAPVIRHNFPGLSWPIKSELTFRRSECVRVDTWNADTRNYNTAKERVFPSINVANVEIICNLLRKFVQNSPPPSSPFRSVYDRLWQSHHVKWSRNNRCLLVPFPFSSRIFQYRNFNYCLNYGDGVRWSFACWLKINCTAYLLGTAVTIRCETIPGWSPPFRFTKPGTLDKLTIGHYFVQLQLPNFANTNNDAQ